MWGHIFVFKNLLFFKIFFYLVILQDGNFIKVKDFIKEKKSYILYLENEGKINIPEERVENIIDDEITKEIFENPSPLLKLKPFKEFPSIKVPYGSLLAKIAKKYNIDPLLLWCIMDVESKGNPYAVSKKGAEGLMQIMPSTAIRFGVKNTFDPKENIEGASKYLNYLNDLFEEKLELVLSGYICGENCVKKFGKVPEYKEVQDYLNKIFKKYKEIEKSALP
jgi:hypothetical protein